MRSLALALVLGVAALAVPTISSTAEANPVKAEQACSGTVAYRGYHYHYRWHGGRYWHRGGYYYRRGC
jgi:hypothetical protein